VEGLRSHSWSGLQRPLSSPQVSYSMYMVSRATISGLFLSPTSPARGLSVSPPHGALRVAAGWLPCDRVESAYLCSTPSPAEAAQRVLNLFVLTRG
jgi:hypothetical protein